MPNTQSFTEKVMGNTLNGMTFLPFINDLRASGPGRQFMQGIGETFGMHYEKGVNMGFMGRKAAGGVFAKGLLGRVLFPAMTAYSAYSGYKEGGIFGAAKTVATDAAVWGALRAGATMLTNPIVLGAAAMAGAGYGAYRFGLAARERAAKTRNLEMGAEVVDMFGTLGTMRQRSLAAINNSRINGRSALGNEALIIAGQYRR